MTALQSWQPKEDMICRKKDIKYIEQLPNGEWVVRYCIIPMGTNKQGEEIVSFASSVYPSKPSLDRIRKSINRYAMAHLDDEEILAATAKPDMSKYMTY